MNAKINPTATIAVFLNDSFISGQGVIKVEDKYFKNFYFREDCLRLMLPNQGWPVVTMECVSVEGNCGRILPKPNYTRIGEGKLRQSF